MSTSYWALHIPTGNKLKKTFDETHHTDGVYKYSSQLQRLQAINRWNEMLPGVWQYWLAD